MVAKENGEERDNLSSDMEKDAKQNKEGDSDYEPARDSLSSQSETPSNEDNKVNKSTRVPKKLAGKEPSDNYARASRGNTNRQGHAKLQFKPSSNGQKKSVKASNTAVTSNHTSSKKPENTTVPPRASSEVSEEMDDKTVEEVKEIDVLDENPNCDQSIGTDDDIVDLEENTTYDDKSNSYQKMQELEQKIERLEEELRVVAALEISLYSVVPEHGSSAHKVHTPARRLSRLFIHACKYWSQDKRATVARNTISGLVLISKSCGSDVPRLTYWLSNTIVLREIISQAFGSSSHSNSAVKLSELNVRANKSGGFAAVKSKNSPSSHQTRNLGSMQLVDDWQDTNTFTTALMKIESWIFSRIVESVWWQALTPHMQSPTEDLYSPKGLGKLSGPAFSDQQQGSFSVNLWKSAFNDAFSRLCPLRSGGHECGCLPILARMVMEQCVSRLDVAMFNAILRESAHEIPTDPVSDPILDPKVLPIPAGNLSFGSGAQLKNCIGNWSRWLTDLFGMDVDDSMNYLEGVSEDDGTREENAESKSFRLLNELSDLLMLPKDMLLDRAIRKEICPSVGLPLMMRILCNFTPDEFCPDTVPGIVLEELNTESILERRLSEKDLISSFPCAAAPVSYSPPLPAEVAIKVADIEGRAELDRRASIVQRKGYTSDDDLEDLDSPMKSIMDKSPAYLTPNGGHKANSQSNSRYKLLREVWSV